MEFRELIERRVSVRKFLPDRVDPGDVREMVRIAGLAPSPDNCQPWRFVAVSRPALLRDMAAAVRDEVLTLPPAPESAEERRSRQHVEVFFSTFFADAPLVIAVMAMPYVSVLPRLLDGARLTVVQMDAMRGRPAIHAIGAAVEHLLLAAADLGYSGCWVSSPLVAREALEHLLEVEAPARLVALVAVGRPGLLHTHERDRKPLEEILRVID